jgi:hypothetical protein
MSRTFFSNDPTGRLKSKYIGYCQDLSNTGNRIHEGDDGENLLGE